MTKEEFLTMFTNATEARDRAAAKRAEHSARYLTLTRESLMASKAALADADREATDLGRLLRQAFDARPAAVLEGRVVGYRTAAEIAAALAAGADFAQPKSWPETFVVGCNLVYSDEAVAVCPKWAAKDRIAQLEAEQALLEAQARRPEEIRAELAALRAAQEGA